MKGYRREVVAKSIQVERVFHIHLGCWVEVLARGQGEIMVRRETGVTKTFWCSSADVK